jgi:hypothetical protein
MKYIVLYVIPLSFPLKYVTVTYLHRWQLCIQNYVIWRKQMYDNLLFKAKISQIWEGRGRSTKRLKGMKKGSGG